MSTDGRGDARHGDRGTEGFERRPGRPRRGRRRGPSAEPIGRACWISLSLYFVIECVVIARATAPYDPLRQPMSDLGVTGCGVRMYSLAPYEICSPAHALMNWTFILTGIAVAVGALLVRGFWPREARTRVATALLVIFGLSYTSAGVVPADASFAVHTLGSLPGMVVQIPALLLIAASLRRRDRGITMWTSVCLAVTTAALILLMVQPLVPDLPGGLSQRVLYGAVYTWMAVMAIVMWRRGPVREEKAVTGSGRTDGSAAARRARP